MLTFCERGAISINQSTKTCIRSWRSDTSHISVFFTGKQGGETWRGEARETRRARRRMNATKSMKRGKTHRSSAF